MILTLRSCLAVVAMLLLSSGCATYQPASTDNICSIFLGDTDWYRAALDSNKRWGTPVWVMMAIIDQESRFVSDAQPARDWFLFIPLPRRSSAYGYAQAQDSEWEKYMKETGNSRHDRDNFSDAINFVGWYTNTTQRTLGISKWDPEHLYLAYHEGIGGYRRGHWRHDRHLLQAAAGVARRAREYGVQLRQCERRLRCRHWYRRCH